MQKSEIIFFPQPSIWLFSKISMTLLLCLDVNISVAGNTLGSDIEEKENTSFTTEERLEEGFVTHYLNEAIAKGMTLTDNDKKVEYGKKVTGYATPPKFGGYVIGKYAYSNKEGAHSGMGWSHRLIRMYVDGKILNDFAYRLQVQTNNSNFHMKDFFVEWQKYPEMRIKVGQFKRAFGFENPLNPWDVGDGDYSQLTKKITGFSDFIGAESSDNGGRDQGLQIQGDLLDMGGNKLLHYQLMIANGQGINVADNNSQKDILGTLQIQPVKGFTLGLFGWKGNFTDKTGTTVGRNRYLIGAKYDRNDWTFRTEYAHSTGHKVSDLQDDGTWKGNARADAWYATFGVPCTPWLKTFVKYDVYRDDASWSTAKSIYSICPNFQLHKNLLFQPQVNYIHDRNIAKSNYCELWFEVYFRF